MEHEVTLNAFTYGGDVMGRLPDGRAVFVPFGLPGERVRIRLTEEKRNFARGELLEILEASPLRVAPRCIHFGLCGGCHYQNLPYEEQLKTKTGILRDQLTHIGRIENPPVREMVASPSPWNYRNHMQFHLTDEGKIGYIKAQARRYSRLLSAISPKDLSIRFGRNLSLSREQTLNAFLSGQAKRMI